MDKNIHERISLVFVCFTMLYVILGINFYRIQIYNYDFFYTLGKKQYHTISIKQAPRAAIYDRNGIPLALNKEGLSAFINPRTSAHSDELKQFLKDSFPYAYTRLLRQSSANFMYIKRRLTDKEELCIRTSKCHNHIHFLKEPSRFYAIRSLGPIIGLTDIDNNGLFGIEQKFNNKLAGSPTIYEIEKDARSKQFYFTKHCTQRGSPGNSITLTIDSNLQFLAYEELQKTVEQFQAAGGAVLIMNPKNGEIEALANIPDFDPHGSSITSLEYTKNRVISDNYELGSVMKMFTALAALEEGVVTKDELIDCHNSLTAHIDGRTINTAPGTARGIIPFYQVIMTSNNIGIAKVAKRLNTKLYDHYLRLGFGTKTGIELPGEQSGFITPPASWSKQSVISLSYGYEIAATLLQLAQAVSIIANDGALIRPTILLNEQKQQNPIQLYSAQTTDIIKEILEKTTQAGTAKRAAVKGYRVMSKTGTANMLTNGSYDTTKNIYTCAGIIKKDTYERIIITSIQDTPMKNVYASTVAAPFFERVAKKIIIHDKVL